MTKEQKERIIELRQRGKSLRDIANELGIPQNKAVVQRNGTIDFTFTDNTAIRVGAK